MQIVVGVFKGIKNVAMSLLNTGSIFVTKMMCSLLLGILDRERQIVSKIDFCSL